MCCCLWYCRLHFAESLLRIYSPMGSIHPCTYWKSKQKACTILFMLQTQEILLPDFSIKNILVQALIQDQNSCFDEYVFFLWSFSTPFLTTDSCFCQEIKPTACSFLGFDPQPGRVSNQIQMCVGNCAISNSVILPWLETANTLSSVFRVSDLQNDKGFKRELNLFQVYQHVLVCTSSISFSLAGNFLMQGWTPIPLQI